ncbi:MAG: glycoside hydrolase family 97 N-terminal domain-containing protein, partial [candidate division Zixibacteria bacterium]|nr:glycoside hydrolase family 97 N-terminal domain-containing protein [candidate division Zixibacteria bacterium]
MFRRKLLVLFWIFIFLFGATAYGKEFELYSPDKEIKLTVDVGRKILYSIFYGSREIIKPSPISMAIHGQGRLGVQPVIIDTKKRSVHEKICPVIRVKSEIIPDVFNEFSIVFKGNFGLVFRAYDEGVAYRFVT